MFFTPLQQVFKEIVESAMVLTIQATQSTLTQEGA